MTYPLMGGRDRPPGWPDRLIIHKYFGVIFFEAKKGKNWLSTEQRERLEDIKERGGNAFVLDLFDDNTCQILSLASTRGRSRALTCRVNFNELLRAFRELLR